MAESKQEDTFIRKTMHFVEKTAVYVMAVVLALYIFVEMVELLYQAGKGLMSSKEGTGNLLLSKEDLRMVLPVFFNILIAIELMDTLKVYAEHNHIKVQGVLLIGLIAIGRKLLILDLGHSDGFTLVGLASLIFALSLGYFLVKTGGSFLGKKSGESS